MWRPCVRKAILVKFEVNLLVKSNSPVHLKGLSSTVTYHIHNTANTVKESYEVFKSCFPQVRWAVSRKAAHNWSIWQEHKPVQAKPQATKQEMRIE